MTNSVAAGLRILFGLCLVSLSNAQAGTALRTGPPDSPLTCRTIETASPGLIYEELLSRGRRLAGEPSVVELVEYTDVHSWGEPAVARRAWRVVVPRIVWRRSENDGRYRSVDLQLLLAEDSRDLLVAYTTPRDEWVLPALDGPEREQLGADALLAAKCDSLGPARTESLTHSVPDVLTALGHFGIKPGDAGQLILRPRTIVKRGAPAAAACWIVEVLGTVVEEKRDEQEPSYFSKRYLVIPDNDLTTFSGFRLH